jgi:hypothetical protein
MAPSKTANMDIALGLFMPNERCPVQDVPDMRKPRSGLERGFHCSSPVGGTVMCTVNAQRRRLFQVSGKSASKERNVGHLQGSQSDDAAEIKHKVQSNPLRNARIQST